MRTTDVGTVEPLDNPVRPYGWGSTTVLPELLGVPPTGQPQAELWIGAHQGSPSRLRSGGTLVELIEADPEAELGPELVAEFGPRLPFLLKVIAAAAPLSLQAHPDLARARAGYAAEEARGIPRDAPTRNYLDPNHKPELICAITPFALLAGFQPVETTRAMLAPLVESVPALRPYAQRVGTEPLPELVEALLTDPLADLVADVAAASAPLPAPAYRTVVDLAERYPGDPAVLIALLMNRVDLAPGEALFLGAGNLHCYLGGTAIEVLANSDNVLRGGLTGKHVDVPELVAALDPTAGPPPWLTPTEVGGVRTYRPPVRDFRLDRITLSAEPVPIAGPSLVLLLDGAGALESLPLESLPLERGGSAWVPAGRTVGATGTGLLVRATAGVD